MPISYAALGSAAHKLAEMALRESKPAAAYLGQTITVTDGEHSELGASGAHRWLVCSASPGLRAGMRKEKRPPVDVPVDEDMADAVQIYLDIVAELVEETGGTLHIERSFCIDWVDNRLWGTSDAVIEVPFGDLYVVDYKHGEGVMVTAEMNEQLMFYAVGAMGENGGGHERVHSIVVQPRGYGSDEPKREATYKPEELLAWANKELREGVKRVDECPTFCTGGHCKGCDPNVYAPAATCPEVIRLASEASCLEGKVITELPQKPILPMLSELSPTQLCKALDALPILKSWFKAIEEHALALLKAGREVLNHKLVAGRKSRGWADEQAGAAFASDLFGREAYTDPKLKSVAKIEAEIRATHKGRGKEAAAKRKELLAKLEELTTTTRGVTMAHVSDSRPAIGSKLDAFGDLDGS